MSDDIEAPISNSLSPEPCVLIPTSKITLHACSVSSGFGPMHATRSIK